jgi:hypothetical protein
MMVLACVDTVRVYGFRPEAPARGRNEVLVAHLVPVPALPIRDFYHQHLPVGGARPKGPKLFEQYANVTTRHAAVLFVCFSYSLRILNICSFLHLDLQSDTLQSITTLRC